MNLVSFMGHLLTENGEEEKSLSHRQPLRESAEQLRLSLCAARAGSWAWDLATGEAYYSDELCEALGLSPSNSHDGSHGSHWGSHWGGHWLERLHPDDRERVQADLRRALDEHQDFESEYRILRPDGGLCWTQSRGWVLYDRDGRPRQIVGLGLDITARKQQEAEREELLAREKAAREAAEAANRAQDEFLALVSHELRSTLNAIFGWSRILVSKKANAEVAERAAGAIERCARMQARLIEDLLDTACVSSGKLRLNMQPVDLPTIIAATLEMARPAAESKGVELRARLAPDIDRINGDPARLQQIIWNLLANAIKFTPRGGRVEIELKRESDQLSLILRDTGRGIAPDFLPYVFDRFRQAPSAGSRRSGGLGLGLALAHELVKLHGGTIDAESPGEGQGATFTIRLPYPSKSIAEESTVEAHWLPLKLSKSLQAASY